MFLFYFLNIFCVEVADSLDFTKLKLIDESLQFKFSSTGTLEKINDKDETTSQLIYVFSKKQNSPYFGIMNSEGKVFSVDSKNPDEIKLITVDSKISKAALCSTGIKGDSPECKSKNSTNTEEENEDDDKGQDLEDDKILIFYLKPNYAKTPTIGIKNSKNCFTHFKNVLNITECPSPGSGGPQYGWFTFFKPRDIIIEKNTNHILNLNEWENPSKPKDLQDLKISSDDNSKEVDKSELQNFSDELKIKEATNPEEIIVTPNDPNLPTKLTLKMYIHNLVKKLLGKENKSINDDLENENLAKNDLEEEVVEEVVDVPDIPTPKKKFSMKKYIINKYKKFANKKKNNNIDNTEIGDGLSGNNIEKKKSANKVLNYLKKLLDNDLDEDKPNINDESLLSSNLNEAVNTKPKKKSFFKKIHKKVKNFFKDDGKNDEVEINQYSNSLNSDNNDLSNEKVVKQKGFKKILNNFNTADMVKIGAQYFKKINPSKKVNTNISLEENLETDNLKGLVNPVVN